MNDVDLDELLGELHIHDTTQATAMGVLESVAEPPSMHRTRHGASTLTVRLADPDGEVWDTLGGPLWATTGALTWDLVAVRRPTAARIVLTFEDSLVAALRRRRTPLSIPAGTTTLAELAERVAAEAQVPVVIDPERRLIPTVVERSTRGDTDSWNLLERAAAAVGCERFSTGRAIVVGHPTWMLAQPPRTMSADDDVLGDITGARDVAKSSEIATSVWEIDSWDPTPGDCTLLDTPGPLAGLWLVDSTDHDLGADVGTVRWSRPTQTWAADRGGEPDWLPNQEGATPAGTPAGAAGRAMGWALRQIGKPFRSSSSGPAAYDAAGLVRQAMLQAGRPIPGGSVADLWDACQAAGAVTTMQAALATPGALLFRTAPIPHVAISLGNGSVVEARGPAYGVCVTTAVRRGWTGGALWL